MTFYQEIKKNNLIAAHRGQRSIIPENTLEAFEYAIGHFDFIELDIQPSKDGVLMVFHDESMERTTNIESKSTSPRPHRLADYNYNELRELDAGSWFYDTDPFGTIKSGIVPNKSTSRLVIPTLKEVLQLMHRYSTPLNIEIKCDTQSNRDEMLNDLLKLITPYRDDFPILISSFNHKYLKKLHTLDETLSLAANVEYNHPPNLLNYLSFIGVCAYHVDDAIANQAPVDGLNGAGIACGVFTVNDTKMQQDYFDKGFRSVFSDFAPYYRTNI